MAGLDTLMSGLNPVGMGLNVLGGVANIFGAIGQRDEARSQLEAQKKFGISQRDTLKKGYTDLISQAKGLPTYTADISRYLATQKQAEQAKLMASGGGRVAGEDIARQQIDKNQANQILASQNAATSSSDLLAAINRGQETANTAQQQVSASSQQQRYEMQQQAQNNLLNTMGQTAAAQAQQAGLQFQSESQRANQVLGLGQEQLGQTMNLEQNLFQQEQAKAAAVAQANAAIWSGVGGIASGIGSGMMQLQQNANQMNMLRDIYNPKQTQNMDALRSAQGNYEQMLLANSAKPTTGIPLANQPAYSGTGFSLYNPQPTQSNFLGLVNPIRK